MRRELFLPTHKDTPKNHQFSRFAPLCQRTEGFPKGQITLLQGA